MPRLPQVSGSDVVGLLQSLGYQSVRQRGSHIQLKKKTPVGEHTITVPAHRIMAKGTLNDILNRISLWNNISKEDLIERLK
ncbi:MAG: type II toxin-antitoxin system HicA family toxin [Dehalococcoidia bacterium]|nr:type II toxin-antitoxin system HicA family toxin [Dehalococcoidia bacterium]